MTNSDAQTRARLAELTGLNLDPDAPALTPRPDPSRPQVVQWAPAGVDPRTMQVSDIVFTPEMVAHFPDLSPTQRSAACQHVFSQYKSLGRNKDRNSLLWRRVGEFVAKVHAERTQPGGTFVKDKIALARTLAENDVTTEDLAAFLAWKAQQQEQEVQA